MVTGNGGHPEIDLLPSDAHLNPPILRHAFLRDTHRAAHHLDPRHNRGQEALRVIVDLDQFTIHPIANPQAGFQWFHMNVGSPHLESFHQHVGHHLDDGRIIGGGFFHPFVRDDREIWSSRFLGFLDPVVFPQGLGDRRRSGGHKIHFSSHHVGQAVEHFEIEGIRHRNGHVGPVILQGDRPEALRDTHFHRLQYIWHDRNVIDVHVVSPSTHCYGLRDLLLGNIAHHDEEINYTLIGPKPVTRLFNLFRSHNAPLH